MLFSLFAVILSSTITALLVYYKIPVNLIHQGLILLLIVVLIYVGKVVFIRGKVAVISHKTTVILLFLTSLLVQLIVISTGGFYSPLLIVVLIYILGSGFLIDISAALTFLILTLIILGGQLFWDQNLQLMFKKDPGITVIYLASFVIVIPLALFVMKTYKVKDKLSKALGDYLHLGRQREESILSGLNELVFITDKDLNIISISDSAQKLLNLANHDTNNKNLLDLVQITNDQGQIITSTQLPIKEVLNDKAVRVIKGMNLLIPTGQNPAITIQLKPIKDSNNQVTQLVFIITDARLGLDVEGHHKDLEGVISKYQQSLHSLKKSISQIGSPQAEQILEILSHIEEDMRTVLEMEDHPIKEEISFDDVAFISKQAVESKEDFAHVMQVSLQFNLSEDDAKEESLLKLKEQNVEKSALGVSDFTAPIDPVWLKLLIQKLLDTAILLGSSERGSKIDLVASRKVDRLQIQIKLQIKVDVKPEDLFIKGYGNLGMTTNLKLGSGIEGFLAHAIAVELKLSLSSQILSNPKTLIFNLEIPTSPQ